jgi:hypothetical protein
MDPRPTNISSRISCQPISIHAIHHSKGIYPNRMRTEIFQSLDKLKEYDGYFKVPRVQLVPKYSSTIILHHFHIPCQVLDKLSPFPRPAQCYLPVQAHG